MAGRFWCKDFGWICSIVKKTYERLL